jgi:hypothetical protein
LSAQLGIPGLADKAVRAPVCLRFMAARRDYGIVAAVRGKEADEQRRLDLLS